MASGILQQPTRLAIYARVSTTNHGQDVNLQTRELEQFAQARGWSLVDSYLDIGISGAKDKRPELDRLMADAHRRKFDEVIVWKFDRFARSVSHLLRALETSFVTNEIADGLHGRSPFPESLQSVCAESVVALCPEDLAGFVPTQPYQDTSGVLRAGKKTPIRQRGGHLTSARQ